jgi:putative addiction module component (TIGR02574 family)
VTRVEEILQQTVSLTPVERAELAAVLIDGLPPILEDEDGGLAEALRRDQELEKNPNAGISWDQLRRNLGR